MSRIMPRRSIRYGLLMLMFFVFVIWNLFLYAPDARSTPRQVQKIDTPTPVIEFNPNLPSTLLPGNLDQVTFIEDGQSYVIRQLLPKDAIRPIYNPEFTDDPEAFSDDELIMGVEINGDARAYSVGYLTSREMVNDTVGGTPILVTW